MVKEMVCCMNCNKKINLKSLKCQSCGIKYKKNKDSSIEVDCKHLETKNAISLQLNYVFADSFRKGGTNYKKFKFDSNTTYLGQTTIPKAKLFFNINKFSLPFIKIQSNYSVKDKVICDIFLFKNIETLNKVKEYYAEYGLKSVYYDLILNSNEEEISEGAIFTYEGRINKEFEQISSGDFIKEIESVDNKIVKIFDREDRFRNHKGKWIVMWFYLKDESPVDNQSIQFYTEHRANELIKLLNLKALKDNLVLHLKYFKEGDLNIVSENRKFKTYERIYCNRCKEKINMKTLICKGCGIVLKKKRYGACYSYIVDYDNPKTQKALKQ